MATPTPAQVGRTNPPLPAGTEVWIPSIGDTVISSAEISPSGYVYYRCAGVDEPVSGMTVYRRRAVVPPPPTDPMPPSMSGGPVAPGRYVVHAVHTDAPSSEDPASGNTASQNAASDATGLRTPAFLRRRRERSRGRVFGPDPSNHPTVTPPLFTRDHRFTGLARLIVNGYGVSDDGLSFQVTVLCGLGRAAEPHDLILVTLDGPGDRRLDTVGILTPPPDQNVCTFSASYTWNQLAKLLGLRRPEGGSARETVLDALPQAGITAEWWDNRTGPNEPAYYSGGLDQRHGSGRIDLRPITPAELKESERTPKATWEAGEPLRENRPVYRAFKDVLQPGMEMATSLEAQTEFLVSAEHHVAAVARLRSLYGQPDKLGSLGAELMAAEQIRRCVDTHYDVPELTLLRSGVMLRRRQVGTDDAGSCRLAVKGRAVVKPDSPGERLRLRSRVHLLQDADPARLGELLADGGPDNAFARILADGLGRHHGATAEPKGWLDLAPRLHITSQRVKYSFELTHATTVDLCADTATATDPTTGESRTVHTIMFTLAHPGFFARDTPIPAPLPPRASGRSVGTASVIGLPQVTRPYHVPSDLDDPTLFDTPDHHQYQSLRDRMTHHLFGHAPDALTPCPDKVRTLATMLGML